MIKNKLSATWEILISCVGTGKSHVGEKLYIFRKNFSTMIVITGFSD